MPRRRAPRPHGTHPCVCGWRGGNEGGLSRARRTPPGPRGRGSTAGCPSRRRSSRRAPRAPASRTPLAVSLVLELADELVQGTDPKRALARERHVDLEIEPSLLDDDDLLAPLGLQTPDGAHAVAERTPSAVPRRRSVREILHRCDWGVRRQSSIAISGASGRDPRVVRIARCRPTHHDLTDGPRQAVLDAHPRRIANLMMRRALG